MHRLFLCLRYLRKRRIVLFPIAAVMLSVALLIVVTSLFAGFVNSYRSHTTRAFGEIVLDPSAEITEYEALAECLAKLPEAAKATPVIRTGALLHLGRGDVRAVELVGVDLAAQCQDKTFRAGLLLQGQQAEMPTFQLSAEAQERARTWLESKLKRRISDDQLPIGAVLGIGVLAKPNDLTDDYNKPAIKKHILGRSTGLSITTARIAGATEEAGEKRAQKRRAKLWLVDVLETGLHDADTNFVYLPFSAVAELIGTGGADNTISCNAQVQITAASGFEIDTVVAAVWRAWRRFAGERLSWPEPWIDSAVVESVAQSYPMRTITREIEKQLAIWQIMLGLICLVVVLLVFVVLFMIVLQKRRDVGIIRSVGASRWDVAAIFLGYGVAIGITGAVLGLALGVLATQQINIIEGFLSKLLGFKVWKSGVYFFRDIPNVMAWESAWWIMLAGVVSAVLGAALPAMRAARMQPVDALRYE